MTITWSGIILRPGTKKYITYSTLYYITTGVYSILLRHTGSSLATRKRERERERAVKAGLGGSSSLSNNTEAWEIGKRNLCSHIRATYCEVPLTGRSDKETTQRGG